MKHRFVLLRKGVIVLIAGASVAGAIGLIWMLITRGEITSLTNLQMLGMLALCLLPGATYAAWEWDRRAARNQAPSDDLFETPEGIELLEEPEPIKPPMREPGREAASARPTADSAQTHRRRNQAVRHPAERD
jgi:hypothetical protein